MPATKVINISLSRLLLRDIDRIAKREHRTRSEFLREAARRYLERKAVVSWTRSDNREWERFSADSFNRIWDNPYDQSVWDTWKPEKTQAR